MLKMLLLPIAIGVLLGLTLILYVSHHQHYDIDKMYNPKATYFHQPSFGCPPGTMPKDDIFERNGKSVPACYNPHGDGAADFLLPGESQHIVVPLPQESPDAK